MPPNLSSVSASEAKGLLSGCSSHSFDSNGYDRRAVVEVDICHRIMAVMISLTVDIVILHKKNYRDSRIREDLPIGVIERTLGIAG